VKLTDVTGSARDGNTSKRITAPPRLVRSAETIHTTKNVFKRTLRVCYPMEAIKDLIIVGVYSDEDREEEYTKPGYEAYARSMVEELVPAEQLFLRTTKDRIDRTMWGSSLGGVVSFYSVWQYPDVFGGAICMSSAFSYKDDLIQRVLTEPRRDVAVLSQR
jgi:enterochelin esterase-like enzyme